MQYRGVLRQYYVVINDVFITSAHKPTSPTTARLLLHPNFSHWNLKLKLEQFVVNDCVFLHKDAGYGVQAG